MPEPHMPRRFGRLPWQAKLRMKRMDRVWKARMAEWRAAEVRWAAEKAAASAAVAAHEEVYAALQSTNCTAPASLPQRAISITDLDDRVVIEVGFSELRLTPEEAARLFAMGRDFGAPQPGAQEAGHA